MLKDIFEESSQHQYYIELVRAEVEPQIREEVRAQAFEEGLEKGRKEERWARLQAERKLLLTIVQIRFPTLTLVAKTQARLIKDATIIEEVADKVSKAQTTEEATNALVSWLPIDDNDDVEEE